MLPALRLLLITTLLAVPSLSCVAAAAQLQSPPNRSRGFGPDACGPVDPSYIHVANETGGQPMFLQRSEAAKAMHLMRETTRSNVETVFRATGKLTAGVEEFIVPVDSSVKRITLTLSMDTKGGALTLTRPSGGAVESGQDRVEDTGLNCGRIVTVEAPEAGNWRARVSGSGTYWVSAQAQSEIYFISVEFVALGGRPGHEGLFRIAGQPLADHPATLEAKLSSRAIRSAEFRLVAEDGREIQKIPMKNESFDADDAEFVGTFELPRQPFRLAAAGLDREGNSYERQFHTLFHAATVAVTPPSQFADVPAGKNTSIPFLVRNVGEADTFRVTVADSHRLVEKVEPQQIELGRGKSGTVVVDMAVPSETAAGIGGDLTFVVQGASGPEAQNSAVVHFSVTEPERR